MNLNSLFGSGGQVQQDEKTKAIAEQLKMVQAQAQSAAGKPITVSGAHTSIPQNVASIQHASLAAAPPQPQIQVQQQQVDPKLPRALEFLKSVLRALQERGQMSSQAYQVLLQLRTAASSDHIVKTIKQVIPRDVLAVLIGQSRQRQEEQKRLQQQQAAVSHDEQRRVELDRLASSGTESSYCNATDLKALVDRVLARHKMAVNDSRVYELLGVAVELRTRQVIGHMAHASRQRRDARKERFFTRDIEGRASSKRPRNASNSIAFRDALAFLEVDPSIHRDMRAVLTAVGNID
jgi:hypothetical protein